MTKKSSMVRNLITGKEYYFEDVEAFSKKLNKLRKSRGLTISELSDEIGWEESNVRSWENNNAPGPSSLEDLCSYFSVTEEYFLNDNESDFEQLSLF